MVVTFEELYQGNVEAQKARYETITAGYEECYGKAQELSYFSAPGRTEVGGNHTDHNHGCVLAAAVNLDIVAVVSPNNDNIVRVKSHGFEKIDDVDLSIRTPQPREAEHSAA